MTAELLMVFVRAPRPGQVKTRLAASLGSAQALAAYKQLVATVLAGIEGGGSVELHYTPDDAAAEMSPWLRPGWECRPQLAGDLGTRMHGAFVDAFSRGASRVVLIGSDCPEATLEDVQSAWANLDHHDLVLGPARDGGYWLIALRQPQPGLFQGMAWSTSSVLQETMLRAQKAGLRTLLLRQLADVDTAADWHEFQQRLRGRKDRE